MTSLEDAAGGASSTMRCCRCRGTIAGHLPVGRDASVAPRQLGPVHVTGDWGMAAVPHARAARRLIALDSYYRNPAGHSSESLGSYSFTEVLSQWEIGGLPRAAPVAARQLPQDHGDLMARADEVSTSGSTTIFDGTKEGAATPPATRPSRRASRAPASLEGKAPSDTARSSTRSRSARAKAARPRSRSAFPMASTRSSGRAGASSAKHYPPQGDHRGPGRLASASSRGRYERPIAPAHASADRVSARRRRCGAPDARPDQGARRPDRRGPAPAPDRLCVPGRPGPRARPRERGESSRSASASGAAGRIPRTRISPSTRRRSRSCRRRSWPRWAPCRRRSGRGSSA